MHSKTVSARFCTLILIIKKSLTTALAIVKDGKYIIPRCHLDLWNPHSHQDTNISPATDVCPHVMEYSDTIYPLTMPSVVHLINCISMGSQPSPLSVSASFIFISTSTVSLYSITFSILFYFILSRINFSFF